MSAWQGAAAEAPSAPRCSHQAWGRKGVSVSKAVLALMAMMPAAISQQVAVGQGRGHSGGQVEV
jgi:hypothetical protein